MSSGNLELSRRARAAKAQICLACRTNTLCFGPCSVGRMPLCSVSLPYFGIAHETENVKITVTGALELDVPGRCRTVQTSIELEDLVRTAKLWIARTGSCYYDMEISVEGFRVETEDQLSHLRSTVLGFQVWQHLGLRLVHNDGVNTKPNRIRLSIQHPDLSSALVPDAAMVARFHRVSFAIDLARTGERERPTKKKAKVTKSTRAASSRGLGGLKLAGNIEFDCLESDDQKAVDEFIVRMNLDTAQREAPRRPKRRSRHTVANEMIYATCTKDMLEICLQNIMVGIKQCPRYMTFVDKSPGKPLSLLAPAVFNMPYLKDISDRKDFLFTIATSLGRMRTAESPSLRRKVEELEAATSKHIEDGSSVKGYYEQGSVQDGIECRLWNLLATEIRTARR